MERSELTRRKFLSRLATGASILAGIASVDGFLVEPRAYAVERVQIELPRLPEVFHGFKIVQISDIHFGPYMHTAGVEEAVRMAKTFQPDLVVLTGDFVSHPFGENNGPRGARHAEPCAEALTHFGTTPMIAVLGNHDCWNDAGIVAGALKDRGIKVLRNQATAIERGRDRLWISGIGDAITEDVDLPAALEPVPVGECTVLLAHEPDFADHASRYDIDLQLSGHSHGGQVRLPGVGALILPELAKKYPEGLNRVRNLQLYTNRGLGVISPPVRFNCPPEITFHTFVRSQKA
jgi:predicted MPP superfamily phosphohydrolase